MEDRHTPGLYLEMTDVAPDRYATERVPTVLGGPGATRARPGGRTCSRDRDDLPRVLPEFGTLGVYEVDDGFAPPAAVDGVAGHLFRATPGPGRGA